MKNFKRNTLMCDFIGAAFCLIMAFAILAMYSGCSEDAGQSPVAHEGGYTEEQAESRLAAQLPVEEKAARSDYVIENGRTGFS